MSDDVVIRAEGLGKKYVIGRRTEQDRNATLRDAISCAARDIGRSARAMLRGRPIVLGDDIEDFWALKDVAFDIKRGEVLGIIGRNGAGKSTLLKVLSRITEPSEGRVTIEGRVASLLEVGTGFHPELSGRENIFLNGAILGMQRAEIKRKFDEIVAFAEVERFLDTPVKRYSSGMYVRLAFAVAAHLEPEILIVDEVLAVGDAEFQKRCLGKMGQVGKAGRTVLFVSHNLSAIRNLCSKGMLFDRGSLTAAGDVTHVIDTYERSFKRAMQLPLSAAGPLVETIEIESLNCCQLGEIVEILDSDQPFQIEIVTRCWRAFDAAEIKISFFRDGVHLTSCFDSKARAPLATGRIASRFNFSRGLFKSGHYRLGVGVSTSTGGWLWAADVGTVEFSQNVDPASLDRNLGMVMVPYESSRVVLNSAEQSERQKEPHDAAS